MFIYDEIERLFIFSLSQVSLELRIVHVIEECTILYIYVINFNNYEQTDFVQYCFRVPFT